MTENLRDDAELLAFLELDGGERMAEVMEGLPGEAGALEVRLEGLRHVP